jgi:acetyl-CoA synthetase
LECAITSVPDEIRGAIVKATVVLAQGYEGTDVLIQELQDHVKKVTAPYKYPRTIEFVKTLPKTISGKIRRVDIRNKDKETS